VQPGYYYFQITAPPNFKGSSYFEVYGEPWSVCKFRSTIPWSGEWNLIDVTLKPASPIATDDHIVLEFPTRGIDSFSGPVNLFHATD